MYKIGEINKLKVIRKTDIGYLLDGKEEEIFLHFNDSNFLELNEGDMVDAFLYIDNKKRLAATLKTPLITTLKPEVLEIVDKKDSLGLFLNMGINKDLLLSKDDLPFDKKQWPKIGEKLFVELNVKGYLVAKLVAPSNLKIKHTLVIGEEKDFFVQYIGNEGINLYNEDNETIFVHHTHYRGNYRLGEVLNVKVLSETNKGFSGSLIKQKEELRLDDAGIILDYLSKNKKIPLTAKSSSLEVERYFEMSRKAFKRALGHLYKEDKVIFTETETILKNGDI